jgi:hypothetical protein
MLEGVEGHRELRFRVSKDRVEHPLALAPSGRTTASDELKSLVILFNVTQYRIRVKSLAVVNHCCSCCVARERIAGHFKRAYRALQMRVRSEMTVVQGTETRVHSLFGSFFE